MDELEIYQALGLEAPESGSEGANEAEPAHSPAAEAAPEPEGEKESQPSHSGAATETEDKPETDGQQSAEERRANAARRREAELEAVRRQAYEQGKADSRAEVDKTLQELNAPDPSRDGENIHSVQELEAYRDKLREQKLRRGELDGETLNRIISEHPTVKAAAEAQADAETAKARAQQEAARKAVQTQIDLEIAMIHDVDPTISSVEDLQKEGDGFRERVRSGKSFFQAYMETHRAELQAKEESRAAKAEQAAGKGHLTATSAKGSGAQMVPKETLEYYKMLMPGLSEAEIRQHYNRYLSGK